MALFKILRGYDDENKLNDITKLPLHDGYAYYNTYNNELYIDAKTNESDPNSVERHPLNAHLAYSAKYDGASPKQQIDATYIKGISISNNQLSYTTGDGVSHSVEGTLGAVTGVKGNAEATYRTGQVNLTSTNIGLGNARIFYGTCSTDAATVAKTVVCPDFQPSDLVVGAIIYVTFTVTNSGAVANLTLNVNDTGAKPLKYFHNNAASNLPGAGYLQANSTYEFQYDGTNWKVLLDYHTYTNDTSNMLIKFANGTFVPSTNLYRYQVLLTKNETTLIPVNAISNDVTTTKTLTTESFNPFAPIYYYSTTGTVNAGAAIGVSYLWAARNNADIRYSFNTGTTLTNNKDVYIVAKMDNNGITAKLATEVNPITQTLPSEDNGYIYIKLGHACSAQNVSMTYDHPIYWYKDGAIRLFTGGREINNITRSGNTFTVTRDDGSSFTFNQQDTNTASAVDNILDGSNSGTAITYAPYTSQQTKLSFDTSTTNPTRTDRLNLNGYLYATKLYSGGKEVLTAHQSLANYKTKQTAVSSATAETTTATTFVYSITQNENGEITVKTRPLPTYNNYTLPKATDDTLGGIKTDYPASGKNYAIKVDANGNAYVNVPWENTHQDISGKLDKSGGTMTGALTLSADPTDNLHAATKQYVDNAFTANDALVFKGTLGTSGDGATVTSLPATHKQGWTYKVVTAGTYAGQECEIGDTIYCITDGTTDNNAHWAIVQTNIDGYVIGPSTSTTNGIAIYSGTTGRGLSDSGKTITTSAPASGSNDTTIPTSKAVWSAITGAAGYNKTGTVTSVAASGENGVTISGSPITSSGTITVGLNLTSDTQLENTAIDGVETENQIYPVRLDANEKLAVNVPWTDTTYNFDGTYDPFTNKAATVSTVTNAINDLDGNLNNTSPSAGKTLTAFSQTNGKVSATFSNISITKSQVTDFPASMPASDVSAWAKASTKPTYSLSEITGTDDLKAIEALTGTSGVLKKTAANTWALDTTAYLPLNGGQMAGPLTWKNITALPEATSINYFLGVESFTDGGGTYYISNSNVKKSLIGSSAIGSAKIPVYWDGDSFEQANNIFETLSYDYTTNSSKNTLKLKVNNNEKTCEILMKGLTIGDKTYYGNEAMEIEATDLGLTKSMTFKGVTETALVDEATTSPISIVGGSNLTPTDGDVVLYKTNSQEFVWSEGKWHLLGLASSFALQNHVHGNVSNDGKLKINDAIVANKSVVTNSTGDITAKEEHFIFKGTCATIAGTAVKSVTCPDFTSTDLVTGAAIAVVFSETNSAAVTGLKLNVNNTGDKSVKYMYNNTIDNIPEAGYLLANQTYLFHYDGTNWVIDNIHYDTDNNTLQKVWGSTTDIELPIVGLNSSDSAVATFTNMTSLSNESYYGAIPNVTTDRPTLNPSNGFITSNLLAKTLKGTSNVSYGDTLPGTGEEGQIFFKLTDPQYELPVGGTTGQVLVKNSDDNRDVAWSSTPVLTNYVLKAGDTMTGALNLNSQNLETAATNVSATTYGSALIRGQAQDGSLMSYIQWGRTSSSDTSKPDYNFTIYGTRNYDSSGTPHTNTLMLYEGPDGTNGVSVTSPAAWRSALGLGTNATSSTAYLPLTGGTISGDLTILKTTSIANNYPATLNFNVKQTDNNITTTGAYIRAYDDLDNSAYGTNMVIQSCGNVIIGGGESPNSLYTNAIKGKTANANISAGANAFAVGQTGENTIICADSTIFFATNCNTIANRCLTYISTAGYFYSVRTYGAVWNDYAEYRKDNEKEKDIQKPGRCIKENGDGTLSLTTKRLERGCEIISDTFGFAIGQDEENGYNTPIASNGRVLAYPYEPIEEFASHIGYAVCSGPNGTVSIMTDEEEEKYPMRAIGTISEIPDYEEWGTGKVKVDGRVWIRIR